MFGLPLGWIVAGVLLVATLVYRYLYRREHRRSRWLRESREEWKQEMGDLRSKFQQAELQRHRLIRKLERVWKDGWMPTATIQEKVIVSAPRGMIEAPDHLSEEQAEEGRLAVLKGEAADEAALQMRRKIMKHIQVHEVDRFTEARREFKCTLYVGRRQEADQRIEQWMSELYDEVGRPKTQEEIDELFHGTAICNP